MKLVVGLGNPGDEYAQTRHNIGFMVLDKLAERKGASFKKIWFLPFRQAKISIGSETVRLIQPLTYMNRSGRAVWGAMKKWRVPSEDIVVIYDDVDLELGAVRVRAKGSGGTHNGMKSVLEWLQTQRFPRVRVGIGPKPEEMEMIEFVLGTFPEKDSLALEKVVVYAADAVESIFSTGIDQTMNLFNQSKAKEKVN